MLRPFFTYYGGKWRAAPKYPAPTHDTIVEPFAGSAGYATRYCDKRVILVEKDHKIASIWRYLIGADPERILGLPDIGPEGVAAHDLEDAERWLIGMRLNNGVSHPCNAPSAWMRRGTHARSFWGQAIRERIASQVGAIRHWTVIEGDYTEAPDITATWFVDPPYDCAAGRHYVHGSAGLDFAALGNWCRGLSGQRIVCEAMGATWLPFRHFADIKANESRNGGKVSREAVWLG